MALRSPGRGPVVCGDPDLPNEPLQPQPLCELKMEHLQGDRTVVPEIAGEINCGHAASAELALEHVAIRQDGIETFKGLEQRDLSNKGSSRLQPSRGPG